MARNCNGHSVPRLFRSFLCLKSTIAHSRAYQDKKITIVHPFHPLFGKEFELLDCRQGWGEYRVYFYDSEQVLISMPAAWTDILPRDPFVELSDGRSFYRLEDLLCLRRFIDTIGEEIQEIV